MRFMWSVRIKLMKIANKDKSEETMGIWQDFAAMMAKGL